MEERLTELETKVMFQDQTIEELNQALCGQQRQLDRLEAELAALKGRMAQLLALLGDEGDDQAP